MVRTAREYSGNTWTPSASRLARAAAIASGHATTTGLGQRARKSVTMRAISTSPDAIGPSLEEHGADRRVGGDEIERMREALEPARVQIGLRRQVHRVAGGCERRDRRFERLPRRGGEPRYRQPHSVALVRRQHAAAAAERHGCHAAIAWQLAEVRAAELHR